jgi:MFS transporter, DHA3 family, macrolide efflux protein
MCGPLIKKGIQYLPRSSSNWSTSFFVIWSGQAVSLFGSAIVQFAIMWWLTQRTGSAASLATAALVGFLPSVLVGPFAGSLMDRTSRKWAMVVADGVTAVSAVLLAFLFLGGSVEPWIVYSVLFCRSIGSAIQGPAMSASTSLMVPARHLTRVASMNQAFQGIMSLAAPPAGAILYTVLPLPGVMAADVITALAAIGSLLLVGVPQPKARTHLSWLGISVLWRDTVLGFRYLWKERDLFMLTTTGSFVDFFTALALTFLPLLVFGHFRAGAIELGWVEAAQGAGVILGGLALSVWGGFRRKLRTATLGWTVTGIALLTVGLAPQNALWLALTGALLLGLSLPVGSAPVTALYQRIAPAAMQGRFFAIAASLSQLVVLLGLILAGLVGDGTGVQLWWVLAGVCHLLLSVYWFRSPSGRRLER